MPRRHALLTALLGGLASSASAAAAPAEVLVKIRSALVDPAATKDGMPTQETLDQIIAMLQRAEQSCSADESGQAVLRLMADAREGYETLKNLSATAYSTDDMEKLKKAVTKASKKHDKASAFDADDTFLESKAEKTEREAKIAKAKAALDAAREALDSAEKTSATREPRANLLPGLISLTAAASSSLRATGSTAKVQVLMREPAVVIVDDWLGAAGQAALAALPAALANVTAKDAPALPRNASDLPAGPVDGNGPGPSLCVPLESGTAVPSAAYMVKVEAAMAAERKLRGQAKDHCGATAALVDEAPDGWDAEEDGDFVGEFSQVADRFTGSSGCGPLTSALDAALTTSAATFLTTSALAEADVLDLSVSAALGFGVDAEAVGQEILDGLVARVDSKAVVPDDWDEEEDGPWEPPTLDAADAAELLARVIKRGGDDAAALGDAYTFSSSPEIVSYFAKAGKGENAGEAARHVCDNFSRAKAPASEPHPAVSALLFLGDATKGGGEVQFPALGVSAAPKAGRLVLFETVTPDGSCDPASAVAIAPLATGSSADLHVLRKTFYTTRAFSREQKNHEGPSRVGPQVKCVGGGGEASAGGCRRHGHIGASKGDAVLPMRNVAAARSCLGPMLHGPCDKPRDYTPPPPPPKKAKPKPAKPPSTPPSTPPVEEGPSAPPPLPGAPPPIQR